MASSLATLIVLRPGRQDAIALAAGLLTLVILVFSEAPPKALATLHAQRLAYPAASVDTPSLHLLAPLLASTGLMANGPLRLLGVEIAGGASQAASREELRTVISEAGAMIPERSRDMLIAILDPEDEILRQIRGSS